jgi:adenylate kinase
MRSLEDFLIGRGEQLDAVIELAVPRDESLKRLRLRAKEQGRTDDTDDAIKRRLDTYERETAPILAAYGKHGIVDTIDGVGSLDDITTRIIAALEARGLVRRAAA